MAKGIYKNNKFFIHGIENGRGRWPINNYKFI